MKKAKRRNFWTRITVRISLFKYLVNTCVVNLIQNSYACYMKLGHYKEAKKCAQYIRKLVPDYIKAYLLDCQCVYFNQAATIPEIKKAI